MSPTDVRTTRLARGWSQQQAAPRLRVSQPYLAMLETGARRLTPELARRVMRTYGLDPTVLPPASRGPCPGSGGPGIPRIRGRRHKPRWAFGPPGTMKIGYKAKGVDIFANAATEMRAISEMSDHTARGR